MGDRPIIFSGSMIRALLDGRKSQTRRALKPQPVKVNRVGVEWPDGKRDFDGKGLAYAPGDRLWVREAHALPNDQVVIYRANWREDALARGLDNVPATDDGIRWRPSIHMPRWASRLTLIVTDVRVQRLQEITEADCLDEGAEVRGQSQIDGGPMVYTDRPSVYATPRAWFRELWGSIHGPDAWDQNPWVAAISFETHRANIDALAPTTLPEG